MKFNRPDCYNWENCSAQLCPMDESSLANCIWYPDEEVCKKTPAPDWVKRQKTFRISPGIEGIDPNIDNWEKEVEKWNKQHPEYDVSEYSKRGRDMQKIRVKKEQIST